MIDLIFQFLSEIRFAPDANRAQMKLGISLIHLLCVLCRDKAFQYLQHNQKGIIGRLIKTQNITSVFFSNEFFASLKSECWGKSQKKRKRTQVSLFHQVFLNLVRLIAECAEENQVGTLHAKKLFPETYRELLESEETPFGVKQVIYRGVFTVYMKQGDQKACSQLYEWMIRRITKDISSFKKHIESFFKDQIKKHSKKPEDESTRKGFSDSLAFFLKRNSSSEDLLNEQSGQMAPNDNGIAPYLDFFSLFSCNSGSVDKREAIQPYTTAHFICDCLQKRIETKSMDPNLSMAFLDAREVFYNFYDELLQVIKDLGDGGCVAEEIQNCIQPLAFLIKKLEICEATMAKGNFLRNFDSFPELERRYSHLRKMSIDEIIENKTDKRKMLSPGSTGSEIGVFGFSFKKFGKFPMMITEFLFLKRINLLEFQKIFIVFSPIRFFGEFAKELAYIFRDLKIKQRPISLQTIEEALSDFICFFPGASENLKKKKIASFQMIDLNELFKRAQYYIVHSREEGMEIVGEEGIKLGEGRVVFGRKPNREEEEGIEEVSVSSFAYFNHYGLYLYFLRVYLYMNFGFDKFDGEIDVLAEKIWEKLKQINSCEEWVSSFINIFRRKQHQVHLLRIFKLILKKTKLQETENREEEIEEDSKVLTTFKETQLVFYRSGVARFAFSFLVPNEDKENVYESLEILSYLVHEGNREVQQDLLMTMKNENPEVRIKFLSFLKLKLEDKFQVLLDQIQSKENLNLFATNEEKFQDQILEVIGITSEQKVLKTLKLIRMLCENCFLEFQNYLRDQMSPPSSEQIQPTPRFETQASSSSSSNGMNSVDQEAFLASEVSVNVVSLVLNFVCSIYETIGQEIYENPRGLNIISQCIKTLIALSIGPCCQNQKQLGRNNRLMNFLNNILEQKLIGDVLENEQKAKLLFHLSRLLLALINGYTGEKKGEKCAKKSMIYCLANELNFQQVSDKMTAIYAIVIKNQKDLLYRGAINPFSETKKIPNRLINAGFNFYMFLKTIRHFKVKHQKLEFIFQSLNLAKNKTEASQKPKSKRSPLVIRHKDIMEPIRASWNSGIHSLSALNESQYDIVSSVHKAEANLAAVKKSIKRNVWLIYSKVLIEIEKFNRSYQESSKKQQKRTEQEPDARLPLFESKYNITSEGRKGELEACATLEELKKEGKKPVRKVTDLIKRIQTAKMQETVTKRAKKLKKKKGLLDQNVLIKPLESMKVSQIAKKWIGGLLTPHIESVALDPLENFFKDLQEKGVNPLCLDTKSFRIIIDCFQEIVSEIEKTPFKSVGLKASVKNLIEALKNEEEKVTKDAYSFFRSFTHSVEISKDSGLEKAFFPIPFHCKFINKPIQKAIIWKSNRNSDQERLETFFFSIEDHKDILKWRQAISKNFVIFWFMNNWKLFKDLAFLLVLLMNILIIYGMVSGNSSPLSSSDSSGDSFPSHAQLLLQFKRFSNSSRYYWGLGQETLWFMVYLIVSGVQIVCALIVWFFSMLERYPLTVKGSGIPKGIRRRLGFRKFSRVRKSSKGGEGSFEASSSSFFRKILFLFLDVENLYNTGYLVLSLATYFMDPLLTSIFLIDLVKRSTIMKNVFRSVTLNWKQLGLTFALALIVIYLYTIIWFYSFNSEASVDGFSDVKLLLLCLN